MVQERSTRSVPHTAIASVTAFFSACITYRVTYQVSNVRERTAEKAVLMMVGGDCALSSSSAFPRISTTVLIPSRPLLACFYARPTLPIELVVKKKIKSIIQASPYPPSAFTSPLSLPPLQITTTAFVLHMQHRSPGPRRTGSSHVGEEYSGWRR